jgi:hypothetical protein
VRFMHALMEARSNFVIRCDSGACFSAVIAEHYCWLIDGLSYRKMIYFWMESVCRSNQKSLLLVTL